MTQADRGGGGALKKPIHRHTDDEGSQDAKLTFKRFTDGRRKAPKGKDEEYEVLWTSDLKTWVSKEKLIKAGFEKLLKAVDDKIAALATQRVRPLTQKFVEDHLKDVGLEAEFATHTRMGALSGGQKVKVVLAASMWNTPHIVILDEPTNYLDRDSLGALADAIKGYDGGVVIISHNAQFVDQVCPEVWHLENHTLNLKGSYDWLESASKEALKQTKEEDTYIDGLGNEVKVARRRRRRRGRAQEDQEARHREAQGGDGGLHRRRARGGRLPRRGVGARGDSGAERATRPSFHGAAPAGGIVIND